MKEEEAMTIDELKGAIENSDMETEAKAEICEILDVWQDEGRG